MKIFIWEVSGGWKFASAGHRAAAARSSNLSNVKMTVHDLRIAVKNNLYSVNMSPSRSSLATRHADQAG